MKMNFEIIPKVKEKRLRFGDLPNGAIFKFKNPDSDFYFWMKAGCESAMKLSNTTDTIKVSVCAEISKYEYKIIIEGK